jgi:hypothetical protein
MTDRDRPSSPEPELSRPEGDEGAMTGATGSLTPDSATDEFVPAERREISDPAHLRDVTVTQRREGDRRHPDVGEPEDQPVRGPTELANLDAGYGSEHGLRPDDPAYRMERHPSASEAADEVEPEPRPRPARRSGDGDEFSDEPEHF